MRSPLIIGHRGFAARFPDNPDIEFILAAGLERSGAWDEAVTRFRALIAKHPDNAASLNYLGYMFADRGVRLNEALQAIQKALDRDPNNGAYLDSLGWVYFRLGKLDEAEQALRRSLDLYRSNVGDNELRTGQAWYALALNAMQAHDLGQADSFGAARVEIGNALVIERRVLDPRGQPVPGTGRGRELRRELQRDDGHLQRPRSGRLGLQRRPLLQRRRHLRWRHVLDARGAELRRRQRLHGRLVQPGNRLRLHAQHGAVQRRERLHHGHHDRQRGQLQPGLPAHAHSRVPVRGRVLRVRMQRQQRHRLLAQLRERGGRDRRAVSLHGAARSGAGEGFHL